VHAGSMDLVLAVVSALVGAGIAGFFVRRSLRRVEDERLAAARAEAAAIKKEAELESQSILHRAETEARERGLELLERAEKDLTAKFHALGKREEQIARREGLLEAESIESKARLEAMNKREREAQSRHDRAKNSRRDVERLDLDFRAGLEGLAATTAKELVHAISDGWIEEARADAAQRVRMIDQGSQDPEYGRQAKRIMGIAIQRYQGHYLTERNISNLPLPPGFAEYLTANTNAMLDAVAQGSGVKLELSEAGDKLRLDSGDGIAKEVARRALAKLMKGTAPRGVEQRPLEWVQSISTHLEREIVDLGKKAFVELEIPKAHPDILKLVGRLNWRTSYTQNQWKHAIEAAFLGGMMAAELGLDVKLTRRATLMHDIGKSLTHEIEGSHAVIGADYARRLGEHEWVANAIGAHHADEPPNSIYAFLVAAADAMSGARPGARREQTEQYSTRLDDLERIGVSFRGVDRAFAVQGGRELRIYVREDQVTDLRAVELSSEIARKISDELTFPGQIKVTVIRQVEAVEVAN
jgi:ribonucrease Y